VLESAVSLRYLLLLVVELLLRFLYLRHRLLDYKVGRRRFSNELETRSPYSGFPLQQFLESPHPSECLVVGVNDMQERGLKCLLLTYNLVVLVLHLPVFLAFFNFNLQARVHLPVDLLDLLLESYDIFFRMRIHLMELLLCLLDYLFREFLIRHRL